MIHWLRLIRWQNLLIILLTQLLAWWCVILPACPTVLIPFNFFLLSTSTILIAAAGYIINDYFDIKIDLLNKPGKVVLEKKIPRKQAIIAHTALNFIALCLAAMVAIPAHHPEWLLLQLGCTLLLWLYSTRFKRQYVTGNVAVALLASLTILFLMIYEPVLQRDMHYPLVAKARTYATPLPVWILGTYAYFAFMLTWMREIVKDMEDYKGDDAEGCMTMPIKKGMEYARHFTTALSLTVILLMCAATIVLYIYHYSALFAYVVALVLALTAWTIFLHSRHTTPHYHNASSGLKVIMVSGICSFFIYYFQLYPLHGT